MDISALAGAVLAQQARFARCSVSEMASLARSSGDARQSVAVSGAEAVG
jgi:hypothetical protein